MIKDPYKTKCAKKWMKLAEKVKYGPRYKTVLKIKLLVAFVRNQFSQNTLDWYHIHVLAF